MKKQIKKLTSIMFAISLILCIIGCKKEPEFNILDYVYTVSFESNGGTEIDSQTVVIGKIVKEPEKPVHKEKPETEKFEGWYTDKDLTKGYDFSAKVKNSFTLYAKWVHECKGLGEWKNNDGEHFKLCNCGIEQNREKCSFIDKEIKTGATCTQAGEKTVYCTVCLDEKEETIPAKGHTLGIWSVTKDPTKTECGQMESVCKVCGETVTKELQPAPEGFRFVKGGTVTGTESWTPSSSVFKSGRKLTIPDLIVSDHEVTRDEYKAVMGSDPSYASAYDKEGNKLTGDDVLNNPVNYVNWYDAIVYCNKLSIKENLIPCYRIDGSTDPDDWGEVPTSRNSTWDAATCDFEANGYRLPTEAEWEWLARGGENYKYAGSDNVDDVAWYTSNTNDTGTREVKTKAPNGYGLYDMSGNVYEWCWDWYGSISSSSAADGAASGYYRVSRGGSWYDYDLGCQVAFRNFNYPDYRYDYCGFRVVRPSSK